MPEPAAPPTPTVWTIKALLDWTGDFFTRKGIAPQTAKLEARILLAYVLKCKPIDLLVRYNEQPPEQSRATFRELIMRRVEAGRSRTSSGSANSTCWPSRSRPPFSFRGPDRDPRRRGSQTHQAGRESRDPRSRHWLRLHRDHHRSPDAGRRVTAVDVSPDALDMPGGMRSGTALRTASNSSRAISSRRCRRIDASI